MNVLYLQAKKFHADAVKSQLKKTTQGSKYFLHQLPKNQFTFELNQLTLHLQDHHLSIHKKDDLENPYLSAYHYTAYFICQNTTYQLHIYFGRKDEVLATHFLQQNASMAQPVKLSEEEESTLISLAVNKSSSFIRSCRAQANTQMKTDKAELARNTNELSAVTNPQQRQTITLVIIEHLKNILDYYPSSYYEHLLKYYQRMMKEVSNTSPTKLPTKEPGRSVQVAPLDIVVLSEMQESTPKSQNTPIKNKPAVTPFITQFKQRLADYNSHAFNAEEIESFILELLAFYQEVYTTQAYCDNEEYIVTLEDENELVHLAQAIEEQRLRIFQHLIIAKKFTSAALLVKPGQMDMQELTKFIHFSLKTANSELLGFLLSQYEFPINTSEFDSLTPVMYCLTKSKTIPQINSCFWVLVKHKASLNEKVPETSLSIMETILFTSNHPLKQSAEGLTLLPSSLEKIEKSIPSPKEKTPPKSVKGIKEIKQTLNYIARLCQQQSNALKEAIERSKESQSASEQTQKAFEEATRVYEEAQKTSEKTQKASEEAKKNLEEAQKALEEAQKAFEKTTTASKEKLTESEEEQTISKDEQNAQDSNSPPQQPQRRLSLPFFDNRTQHNQTDIPPEATSQEEGFSTPKTKF